MFSSISDDFERYQSRIDQLKEENQQLKDSLIRISISFYNQALEDAAENATMIIVDKAGNQFYEGEKCPKDEVEYVKVDKQSILKLKKCVSGGY
jgi:hypothetical protein